MNEAQEESIILLSHVMANILNPKFAHTVITEPLSVRVRAAGEPNPFQAATWAK